MTNPYLPSDIYEQIAATIPPQETQGKHLHRWNQFDVRTHFGAAFFDTTALIEHTLLAWPSLAITPRLTAILMLAKEKSMPIGEFVAYFATQNAESLRAATLSVSEYLTHTLNDDPWFRYASAAEQEKLLQRTRVAHGEVMDDNMSQAVRNMQDQAWNQCRLMFAEFVKRLHDFLELRGYAFSLRPFTAMNLTQHGTLQQLSYLAGIPIPQLYWTKSMEYLHSDLDSLGIYDKLFNPRVHYGVGIADFPKAQVNHGEFNYWNSLAAYAVMVHEGDDINDIAITKTGMPPWLLDEVGVSAPIYPWHPWNDLTTTESAVTIDRIDGLRITDLPHYESEVTTTARKYARYLHMCCLGVTLHASTIRLGQGHRRPSWVASPPNRILIERFMQQLPIFIKELRDV